MGGGLLEEGTLQRFSVLLILAATRLIAGCESYPETAIIQVPDHAFLSGLIANGVDRNGDGLISEEEADAVRTLRLPPSGITDLTGLEAFSNLDSFRITLNPLSTLNLSENKNLRFLECTSCELSELDVSQNPLLEELDCGRNALTGLDVSKNPLLTRLILNNNRFTSLDLSSNGNLTTLITCGNQLTRLDLSGHANLKMIGVDNMPMLTEVCVWVLPFPPEGVTVLRTYSPNIQFTTTCTGDSL